MTEIMRHCHGNHPLQLALPPLLSGSHDPPQSCDAGFVEGRKNQIPKRLNLEILEIWIQILLLPISLVVLLF